MAYREVTMTEVREVVRQWLAGVPKKRIAARLGCDAKTVRRYLRAATELGIEPNGSAQDLSEERFSQILARARPPRPASRGLAWSRCQEQRAFIKEKLDGRVRLSKIRRLLQRRGVIIPYPTLHRFAVAELAFGRRQVTVPVADGEPGKEVQVDTGWVILLEPDATGRRRRVRAWIFTPVVSRYRFVYPCHSETTASAIEACEAAWEFYGGVFEVLIPDNTRAIVTKADPLAPVINQVFLEYSQSRDFYIDPARVRTATDKARVERSVRDVRDMCFGGETIHTLEQARERGLVWSTTEYGLTRHTSTGRLPKEHFESDERPRLHALASEPFDIPSWHDPKVGRDHFAAVAKSLYTIPTAYCGRTLRARADSRTVRFYDRGTLVKAHPRVAPGKKSIDPNDFPPEKTAYAMRDIDFLEGEARQHGEAIGDYAHAVLAGPMPWTRMRQVYALLSLVTKYGAERVAEVCTLAAAAEMIDVTRLRRMLEQSVKPKPAEEQPRARVIPIARYLREPSQYALPIRGGDDQNRGGKKK